jgi:hypothetical protein
MSLLLVEPCPMLSLQINYAKATSKGQSPC